MSNDDAPILNMSSEPDESHIHHLIFDGRPIGKIILESDEYFDPRKFKEIFLKRKIVGPPKYKYEEQKTTEDAENFAKKLLKTKVGYGNLMAEMANDCNKEFVNAMNIFGTVGIVRGVFVDNEKVTGNTFASYDPESLEILLRSDRDREAIQKAMNAAGDYFSTNSHLHQYRHEIGHALWEYFTKTYPWFHGAMLGIYNEFCSYNAPDPVFLSVYAKKSEKEMFAEATAQLMDVLSSEPSKSKISKLTGMVFQEILAPSGKKLK